MRRVYKSGYLLAIVCIVTILSSACMGTPTRDAQRYENGPILWLYNHTTEGELPSLYRQIPGEEPLKIADHVVPGSHRVHDGNVLFLDDQGALYYAQPQQEPHRLLEDVRPYSYGFFDGGLKVFAVSDHGELWFKTFGTDAQPIANNVEQVIRLPQHLLVFSDGTVHSYDKYGEGHIIADNAESIQLSDDGYYGLISMVDQTTVTDGVGVIHTFSARFEQLGFVHMSGDGSKIVFLDRYDGEVGNGRLWVQEQDAQAVNLSDMVDAVAWDEEREQLWYTTAGELKLATLQTGEVFDISDQVINFALSETDGSIAVALHDGTLMVVDSAGDLISTRPAEGIRRLDYFGAGILYATEDGNLLLATTEEDDLNLLGRFDHWLYDERYIVYVQDDRVVAVDDAMTEHGLLDDRRSYRYVYYGERLLAETLLRVSDVAGVWHTADERMMEIRSSGRQKGTIKLGNSDARPFYVTYAAYDHLKLMVVGELEHEIYVRLRSDGLLELHNGEELTEYARNP